MGGKRSGIKPEYVDPALWKRIFITHINEEGAEKALDCSINSISKHNKEKHVTIKQRFGHRAPLLKVQKQS